MMTIENKSFDILKLTINSLIVFDSSGCCKDAIIDTTHWFSDKSEKIIGKNLSVIFPNAIQATLCKEFELVLSKNSESNQNYEFSSDDSRFVFQIKLVPFQEGVIAFVKDITKNKALLAKELEPIRNLLANISHQLINPLNVVVGFSRLLCETDKIKEKKEYIHIIESNNSRLISLVKEILEITRIDSGLMKFNFEYVNLQSICKEVYCSYNLRIPYEADLIFEGEDCEVSLMTDKNRLIQIFSILISNAIKFTSSGSIKFGYNLVGDVVKFYVKDTGIGIPEDKLKNIFDRFFKVDSFTSGTGLGLSICKSIVERLGGSIGLTSKFGEGSCFTFTLPLHGAKST